MLSSINFFLSVSLIILLCNPKNMRALLLSTSSEAKSFEFHSLPQGYLTFLGDSHLQDKAIVLTKEVKSNDAPKSAGVVLYRHPILFVEASRKKVPSFCTMFTFSIENIYGEGDGLAFLISPDDRLLGSPGYLGLVDSTDLTRNKFIAIEFDTKRDPMFHDPDDNHLGLDINNLLSVKLAKSSSLGVDFKSGNLINSWIDYKSDEKRLEVFLSYSHLKPSKPLLKVDIDLSDYLKDNMFVGFSAGTEGSMQLIHIDKWVFTVMEFSPPPPPPSPPESGTTFPNPSESGHRHSHLRRFVVGLIVGVCSIPFIVFFGWFCWKKLMVMIQRSGGRSNLEMQTIRSPEAISCQEILLSFLVDELARGLNIKNNDGGLIRVKAVKSSIPPCNSLPAVKPSTLPLCNGLPLRTTSLHSDDRTNPSRASCIN